ncbi:ATP-binding protein [Methylobacterium indicum]|uniref:ATP-binding protein n=1 Tax=Methylobacterium indicum TaxID=1775910 RepID=UPI000B086FCD|nr:ATP-binding protein [Methylobacterium indicum]
MLGNLVENACRWCAGLVRVSAQREDSSVVVMIDDDGPGLAPGDRAAVLQRGRRLDESEPGAGFGLPIALELAELYGGSLEFEESSLGGLAIRLVLPG